MSKNKRPSLTMEKVIINEVALDKPRNKTKTRKHNSTKMKNLPGKHDLTDEEIGLYKQRKEIHVCLGCGEPNHSVHKCMQSNELDKAKASLFLRRNKASLIETKPKLAKGSLSQSKKASSLIEKDKDKGKQGNHLNGKAESFINTGFFKELLSKHVETRLHSKWRGDTKVVQYRSKHKESWQQRHWVQHRGVLFEVHLDSAEDHVMELLCKEREFANQFVPQNLLSRISLGGGAALDLVPVGFLCVTGTEPIITRLTKEFEPEQGAGRSRAIAFKVPKQVPKLQQLQLQLLKCFFPESENSLSLYKESLEKYGPQRILSAFRSRKFEFSEDAFILVILEQYDDSETFKITLPGGKRQLGETSLECALREFAEETHIRWFNKEMVEAEFCFDAGSKANTFFVQITEEIVQLAKKTKEESSLMPL
jgi:hypothetical protein